MTPEEYKRLKEAEKEHLRKLKEIKEKARVLRRQQSVTKAMEELGTSTRAALDTHEEMLDKLEMDTAMSEARFEIALEATQAKAVEEEARAALEAHEEDLQKARAQELLRQMKLQVGSPEAAPQAKAPAAAAPAAEASPEGEAGENPTNPPGELPEKTIGRMKP